MHPLEVHLMTDPRDVDAHLAGMLRRVASWLDRRTTSPDGGGQ